MIEMCPCTLMHTLLTTDLCLLMLILTSVLFVLFVCLCDYFLYISGSMAASLQMKLLLM